MRSSYDPHTVERSSAVSQAPRDSRTGMTGFPSGDGGKSASGFKTQFKTPEGRYTLTSEKAGIIPFNHLRQTRLTLASLKGGQEAGNWLIYNVADFLHICRPNAVQKDPVRSLGFNLSSSRTGFPTCHDFMPAKDGIDLLIGLGDGQVALLSLRAHLLSNKMVIAGMLAPEASNESPRCTAVAWVPRSEAGTFAAAFTSGYIYIYKKVNVLSETSSGISKFTLGSSKSKASQSPFSTFCIHPSGINDMAITPDGMKIATACSDGALRIVELATGSLIGGFQSYYGSLICCSISPDGKYVAAGGEDDLIAMYGMMEKYPVAFGEGHSSWISRVYFDPWGGTGGGSTAAMSGVYRVGSAGQDARMCLWELQSPTDADLVGAMPGMRKASSNVSLGNLARGMSTADAPASPSHGRKPSVSSKPNGITPALPRAEMDVNEPIVDLKLHGEPMSDILFCEDCIFTADHSGCIKAWSRPEAVRT